MGAFWWHERGTTSFDRFIKSKIKLTNGKIIQGPEVAAMLFL